MTKIKNELGTGSEIDFEVAVNLMDAELAEEVHSNGDQDPQAFFNNYCAAHFEKFGEEFEPNKANGQW